MRATTIHAPGDIRLSDVPDPRIEAPTDAIVRVAAGLHLRLRPVALPRRQPDHAGPPDRPRVRRRRRGGRRRRPHVQAGRLRHRAVHALDNTCPHCRAGMPRPALRPDRGLRPTSGQGEHARVPQADGTLVTTDGCPTTRWSPRCSTLSDVMGTGWHAAVAAGVQPGRHRRRRRRRRGRPVRRPRRRPAWAPSASSRCRATSRARQLAREFGATDIVAERGEEGEARIRSSPTASAPTPCSSASAPTSR